MKKKIGIILTVVSIIIVAVIATQTLTMKGVQALGTCPSCGSSATINVSKEPTCTEEGIGILTCSTCSYSGEVILLSLGRTSRRNS